MLESQGSKRDDRDDSVAVIVSILESDRRPEQRNRLRTNESGISILPSTGQNGDSLGVRDEKVWPHE